MIPLPPNGSYLIHLLQARSVISSMVSLGVCAVRQVHPRATWPMEVVTVSMYVTPEASSCTMWLVHIIATVGSSIASSCMCSRGTSETVTGDGPPCRQAITSSKLGVWGHYLYWSWRLRWGWIPFHLLFFQLLLCPLALGSPCFRAPVTVPLLWLTQGGGVWSNSGN